MATENIKLEHEGHEIVVPYDAVAMIMIAKNTVGYPIQSGMTLIDECIARVMKSCQASGEGEKGAVDYRVLLNGSTIHLIYKEVTAAGGIDERFPGKQPKPDLEILEDFLIAAKMVGDMRGLSRHECRRWKDYHKSWIAFYDQHMPDLDATETDSAMLTPKEGTFMIIPDQRHMSLISHVKDWDGDRDMGFDRLIFPEDDQQAIPNIKEEGESIMIFSSDRSYRQLISPILAIDTKPNVHAYPQAPAQACIQAGTLGIKEEGGSTAIIIVSTGRS
ncbi:MAG: hypothetical protein Q9191_002036 [Dirinaria sp. TL-2023a]